jgi:photosystem II stability/assembly factor-like uncharacterized protein
VTFSAPLSFNMLRPLLALVLLPHFLTALVAVENSEPAPLAPRALLLDVTRAGDKIVAVGDRGHVVISADEGVSWRQSVTPTRAMLTGVSFADAEHGWAVGHDGVILATRDGGRTWKRQDGGTDLETILLDVLFLDAQRGFAVGAYGQFRVTQDGGSTWTQANPLGADIHYNRITRAADGVLYLTGEAGTFATSRDDGATWTQLEVPYEGSLFATVAADATTVVLAGLRGRILVSADQGETWRDVDNPVKVLLMAGTRLDDGTIILAGQGGNFFLSRNLGLSFRHWKPDDFGTSVADIITTRDGALLTVGEAGAVRIQLP